MKHVMKYQGLELLAFTLGAILASGCGGTTTAAATCDAPTACGGDLVGVWQVSDSCLRKAAPVSLQSCPSATATVSDLNLDGTIEFRADGSELTTGTEEAVSRISFPTSCLQGATCAEWGTALSSGADAGVGGSHPASCTAGAQSCDCTLTVSRSVADHDTFTSAGTQVTTTSGTSGSVTTQSYCVQGSTLTMWDDKLLVHATRK